MGTRGAWIGIATVALALSACERKPAPTAGPAVPAATPAAAQPPPQLSFRQNSPDAEVALTLPAAVAAVPALYTKLYSEGRNSLLAFAEGSKGELEELRANGEATRAYAATLDYFVSAETPRLISLVATRMENTGGAHPNTTLEGLTWDKQAGRKTTAAALFRPDLAQADKALCDAIRAAKQARAGDPALTGSRKACPTLASIELALAPSTVPGKAGGLIALFSTDDLGAYAEGDYRIVLPLAAIQPALAPEYAAEFAGRRRETASGPMIADRRAFILANTRLQAPPHTPELRLYLADEITPIWRLTEEGLESIGMPPPFWAFAWAGGQALARYLLDNPQAVQGRRVLDFATGGGIVAIAAMRAGAASTLAADIDPFCADAVALNAEANGVAVAFTAEALLDSPPPEVDLILAGDIAYEKPVAERVRAWLAGASAKGARVLIGDPHRTYFDPAGLVQLAAYQVPTTRELEDSTVKSAGVWTFAD